MKINKSSVLFVLEKIFNVDFAKIDRDTSRSKSVIRQVSEVSFRGDGNVTLVHGSLIGLKFVTMSR